MPRLVVAALSARLMAEAAAREGFEVIALDLFGDADTRRAARAWMPIGDPARLRIDHARTLAALEAAASRGDVLGWIPGAGFEGDPELLAAGAARLPLIGTAPDDVRRVRDPALFFGALDALGIAHPPVADEAPAADVARWLLKDSRGSGGWHIRVAARRAGSAHPAGPDTGPTLERASHSYAQREAPGRSMSATFVANGSDAVVLGFNVLTVRPMPLAAPAAATRAPTAPTPRIRPEPTRPHVYCGAIGPVPLPEAAAHEAASSVRRLAAAFRLRGLGSLDFLLDGERVLVLEVNPRPPASLALYPGAGWIGAQLASCLDGRLPPWPVRVPVRLPSSVLTPTPTSAPTPTPTSAPELVPMPMPMPMPRVRSARPAGDVLAPDTPLRGTEIVFARHHLPAAGTPLAPGDPLCSVDAEAPDEARLRALLAARRERWLDLLETPP